MPRVQLVNFKYAKPEVDAVVDVSFDPREGGVAEPVGGNVVGGDPGESVAEAFPEVVAASAGEGTAVSVAQ
jgi:hypothetical protein